MSRDPVGTANLQGSCRVTSASARLSLDLYVQRWSTSIRWGLFT